MVNNIESNIDFDTTFQHAAVGMAHIGLDGKWLRVNKKFCDITGYKPSELAKLTFAQITHPDDLQEDSKYIKQLMEGKIKYASMEKRYIRKDGKVIWVEAQGSVVRDEKGNPKYGIAVVEDIDQRKKAEFQISFMTKVAEILAESLDYPKTMAKLTRFIASKMADLCVVDLVDEEFNVSRIKVACSDPSLKNVANLLLKTKPSYSHNGLIGLVLRSKKPILLPEGMDSNFAKTKLSSQSKYSYNRLNTKSVMSVPILIRGRLLGSITLIYCKRSIFRVYDKQDLRLAQLLASRAAYAIENSILYQKAQEAIRQREEFISIASHELKTPLTTLSVLTQFIWTLLSKTGDKKLMGYFEKLDVQVHKMSSLVNYLLDINVLKSDHLVVKKKHFDLAELVFEVVESSQSMYGTHSLVFDCKDNFKVFADRSRVAQVITNLISNAVKYSPNADRVCIKIDKTKGMVCVSVEDFGFGIFGKNRDKIFDRFYRVPGSQSIKGVDRGLGLGLYISRQIANSHKGSLVLKTSSKNGSTFAFSLPLKA